MSNLDRKKELQTVFSFIETASSEEIDNILTEISVHNLKEQCAFDRLWEDFLELGTKHSDKMTVHEFGFSLARFITGMLLDCAPNKKLAIETMNAAIETAVKEFENE